MNFDSRGAALALAIGLGLSGPSWAQASNSLPVPSNLSSIATSPSKVATKENLPVVAITTLESKGGVDPSEVSVIADNLAVQLQQSGAFRVMERSQMERILKEQNFQQSGACDGSQCAVEMGKLLGIDKMVLGSVGRVGQLYSLSLRLVDVGTGEAVRTTARNKKGTIEDVLTDLLPLASADLTKNSSPKSEPSTPLATKTAQEPTPTEPVEKQKSKTRLWPWLVGGAVVAGGGVAAVVLLSGKSSTSSSGETPPPATENHFQVSW